MLVCVTLTVSPSVILGILLVSTAYSTHLATFALCNSYKASNFFLRFDTLNSGNFRLYKHCLFSGQLRFDKPLCASRFPNGFANCKGRDNYSF